MLREGREEIIPAEQVQVGDRIRVLPGESVPVDGVIVSGQTSINQAVMTGESLPVDKTVGDSVSSGTVNQFGAFEMEASKVGEDSSIQRMIRLVQSADAGKAKIVGIADRWATWIVVIALSAAALTWLLTGQIIRAVTILVVFCPCALVLATPTAIMAAIGNATKHGFLVREGDALERLAEVKVIAFDKTGTLTYGTPEVVAVASVSESSPRRTSTGWPPLPSSSPSTRWARPSCGCCQKGGRGQLAAAEDVSNDPRPRRVRAGGGQGRSGGQPGAAAGTGRADDAYRQRRKSPYPAGLHGDLCGGGRRIRRVISPFPTRCVRRAPPRLRRCPSWAFSPCC